MRGGWAVVVLALVGCGRLWFDELTPGGGGNGDALDPDSGSGSAGTPIRYLKGGGAGTSGTSTSLLPLFSIQQGHLVIVVVDYTPASATLTSLTDSAGNSYAILGPNTWMSNRQYIAYTIAQSTGNLTVTATLSANAGNYFEIRFAEYMNVASTSPLDASFSMGGSTTGTDLALGSITTTGTAEMIVAFVNFVGGTGSEGTGWTRVSGFNTGIVEQRGAAVAGTYDVRATFPSGTLWAVDALAFKPP